MSQAKSTTATGRTFTDDEGNEYLSDRYEGFTKSVGRQREVANWWADMKVPVHSNGILRTSTGNFKGIHKRNGAGKLKHYAHIEAIRSRTGLIVSDTECYARGHAKCTVPSSGRVDGRAPLTSLKDDLRGKDFNLYDMDSIETVEIDTDEKSKKGRLIGFINRREMVLVTGKDSTYASEFFDEAEKEDAEIILDNLA